MAGATIDVLEFEVKGRAQRRRLGIKLGAAVRPATTSGYVISDPEIAIESRRNLFGRWKRGRVLLIRTLEAAPISLAAGHEAGYRGPDASNKDIQAMQKGSKNEAMAERATQTGGGFHFISGNLGVATTLAVVGCLVAWGGVFFVKAFG